MDDAAHRRIRSSLSPWSRCIARLIITALFFCFAIAAVGIASSHVIYTLFSRDLPSLQALKNYLPPTVTRIYADNGDIIGEYFKEKRYVIPIHQIPGFVIKAFVAAEDNRFFEHQGVDYQGILRAFLKNLETGEIVQGGSTITQQVTKSLLLSPEKSLQRKIREAILSLQLEKYLSKEEILFLYLNQIYLGYGAYGVEAAAQNYFNKHIDQLNLAEAAMLAGLPSAPSRYSPAINPDKARERQRYVLEQMNSLGYITEEELQQALKTPIHIWPRSVTAWEKAPYFSEFARQYVEEKYGRDLLYTGGLSVYTTVNLQMQEHAQRAMQLGLRELDKRQGFRGPLKTLERGEIEAFCQEIHSKELGNNGLSPEKFYTAVVTKINNADKEKKVTVRVGSIRGTILLKDMRWAQRPTNGVIHSNASISDPADALRIGDVIKVCLKTPLARENAGLDDVPLFLLEQKPLVQSALLSIENKTGYVKAMVGGRDFSQSQFNRCIQSRRQPGSAFKPIIYAAAIDKNYTPSSIILDTPIVYYEKGMEKVWKPKNYEKTWKGPTTLRTALIKSRNIVTVKILMDIGVQYALKYAQKMGIISPIYPNLSMALGASGLSLLELTSAYSIFPNLGLHIKPIFITKIVDRHGQVLKENLPPDLDTFPPDYTQPEVHKLIQEEREKLDRKEDFRELARIETSTAHHNQSALETQQDLEYFYIDGESPRKPPQIISPSTAYIMTHLLKGVVQHGTGWRVRALGKPVAGKTGTTNNLFDAWFIGFTPSFTTGVWVGFDEEKPLGRHETGSRAASPIWLDFMKKVTAGRPPEDFPIPPKIIFARIDSDTGLLADRSTQNGIYEAFKEGMIPSKAVPLDQIRSDPRRFFENSTKRDKKLFLE